MGHRRLASPPRAPRAGRLRRLAAPLICAALLGAADIASADTQVWSGTITVGKFTGESVDLYGYNASLLPALEFGTLSDTSFVIGGTR